MKHIFLMRACNTFKKNQCEKTIVIMIFMWKYKN